MVKLPTTNNFLFQNEIICLARRGFIHKRRSMIIVLIKWYSKEGGSNSNSNPTSEVAVAWMRSTFGWSTPRWWGFSIKILRWEVLSNCLRVVRVKFSSWITHRMSTKMSAATWVRKTAIPIVSSHLLGSTALHLPLYWVTKRGKHKAESFPRREQSTSLENLN